MLLGRPLFLAFSNGTETSIPGSSRTAPMTLFKASFGESRALESVLIGYGKHLRVEDGKDPFVSGPAHSMALKDSGALPNSV